MPYIQPSLRDLFKAEHMPPTLKRWAIVGESLRDKDKPDPILRQSSAPTARDRTRFFACFGRGCRQSAAVEKKQAAMADVLPTHTPELFRDAVQRAAELLRAGEAVALPTETVYGLAANALDAKAVERIFQIKGRPAHNPIIVHVASMAMAKRCVASWPALAGSLAKAFWPGPLTLVLPRAKEIPGIKIGRA